MLVRFIATFVGSMIYPFTQNWPISLVVCSAIPIMFLVTAITGYFMEKVAKVKNAKLYDNMIRALYNTNMVLGRNCDQWKSGCHCRGNTFINKNSDSFWRPKPGFGQVFSRGLQSQIKRSMEVILLIIKDTKKYYFARLLL